jgi:hypothetical protein
MRCRPGAVATRQGANVAEPCHKRRFGSASAVRRGHAGARFRVRAYRCDIPHCGGWHATANDKRRGHYRHEAIAAPRSGGRSSLAPVRTLAEVEAIAQEMRRG